jgi:stage V sporulation protein D (sporulation-specific penicillin-binding protein)
MSPFHRPTDSARGLRRRGRVLAFLLALGGLVVVGRLVQLQVIEAGHWRAYASVVQERTLEVAPRRGSIFDRDGTPLAYDVKAAAVAVDGYNMTKPETLVAILSEELARPTAEISDLVYRSSYFTWIDRSVELATAQRIEERTHLAGAYGLILFDTWKRCYPEGRLASNVIGFVGTDGVGLEGIELQFDETLRGLPSRIRVIEGADGRTYKTETIEEGTPGADVTLTVDADLQFVCEEEIESGVSRFRANGGMIVVLDPDSGEILAMAQDKGYDLNEFWTSTPAERKNSAVTTLFEPGSIFKVFTGLAALEAGAVRPTDTFDGNDGIEVAGHLMHNADHESYGTVTFAEIIEHSVNTGMIRVALLLGEERLHDALALYGFGEPTGVDLPGEEDGILRPADAWSRLDLAASSIGQSVAVTGIQLARGMAAVAADGRLPDVRIVIDEAAPSGRAVASSEVTATMRQLMERVVESGTGTLAAVDGFSVAGKTGTAQKATPGLGYSEEKYTSLFAGLLPAADPTFVVLVVLDEVKSGPVAGGVTAGQIFRSAATRMAHVERLTPTAEPVATRTSAP